ncbi:ankyrin repeat domain-containing protein [Stenotrophomonas sp. Marseille-Q4652]|uniref:ankyrin repeat domain-containing protein n=1 Tax=Stenotrophomonas sp. Marseille-Q4652 TaxID=2866595 RepID=UPI001CE42A59|nr:ankyrin repeat domain-containing protein [Stenotrophomonas sp. Marseille-Q4652]
MTALRWAIERNDGVAVDALLAQDSSLAADTYFAGDQPAGCPKCGSRTAFTEGSGADGPQQVHFCGPCDYAFVVVEDLDPEEPMDLDRDPYQLHTAALRADLPALRQAVREGADLDALNERGMSPLHLALAGAFTYDHTASRWEVSRPHLEAFHELLTYGADPDRANAHGFTVRQQAEMMGLTDEHGPTTSAQLFAPLDPVAAAHEAVQTGDVDALRRVVARVPDGLDQPVATGEGHGPTLLHLAAGRGDAAMVDVLLRHQPLRQAATLNSHFCGMTPLYMAASSGNVEAVKTLLRAGAMSETDTVAQPLHVAAEQPRPAVLAALLEDGADANSVDANGATALHVAARKGNTEHARLLADAGADLDAPDALGRTPRQVAAGNADVLAAMSQGRSAWEQRERATDEHASLAPVETLEAKLARLEAENAQLRLEREKLKTSLQGVLELNAPSPAPRRASP